MKTSEGKTRKKEDVGNGDHLFDFYVFSNLTECVCVRMVGGNSNMYEGRKKKYVSKLFNYKITYVVKVRRKKDGESYL